MREGKQGLSATILDSMRREYIAPFFAFVCLALAPHPAFSQADFEFRLGFKVLASMIPQVVGEPLENERHNPTNGDALQRTTKGLMVWRKVDNWTAFTDGSRTWINGPLGLQERRNDERFDWEIEPAIAQTPTTETTARPTPNPSPDAAPALPSLGVRSPEPAGEWVTSISSNTKYYTTRGSSYWKNWSPRNLIWFATEGELLSAYPGRVRK